MSSSDWSLHPAKKTTELTQNNGSLTFLMKTQKVNFTIYWIIANTSAITYNFFGHFKFCSTMVGGYFLFNDIITVSGMIFIKITGNFQTNQGVGIVLTLIGVFAYSRLKFLENARAKQTLPMTSKGQKI